MRKFTALELYKILVLDESFRSKCDSEEGNIEKEKYYEYVGDNLVLELNSVRQKALKRLIRSENRELKIDEIERYLFKYGHENKNKLCIDMRELIININDSMIEKNDVYNIKLNMYENWKSELDGLDEDFLLINRILKDMYESKSCDQIQVIKKMGTFIEVKSKSLEDILKKGIGIQHIHYSMIYPAVYSWIVMMNYRCTEKKEGEKASIDYCSDSNIIRTAKIRELLVIIAELYKHEEEENKDLEIIEKQFEEILNQNTDEDFKKLYDETIKLNKFKTGKKMIKKCINKKLFKNDYAINQLCDNTDDFKNTALIGERLMLFFVLKYLQRAETEKHSSKLVKFISKIFWFYIVDKNRYLYNVQHTKNMIGFDAFTYRMGNGERELDKYIEEDTYSRHIAEFLQESGYVTDLEVMIPYAKVNSDMEEQQKFYDKKLRILKKIQKYMDEKLSIALTNKQKKVNVTAILEFKKKDGEKLSERIVKFKNLDDFNLAKKNKNKKNRKNRKNKNKKLENTEAYKAFHTKTKIDNNSAYKSFLDLYEKEEMNIVGIDVADKELYCPPEIFVQLYRAIDEYNFKNSDNKKLYKTYHVGEDFNSIMTGMRRVFESIHFLNMGNGSRLGHCSVLGLDIEHWCQKYDIVTKPRIDILDDAVFEWHLLKLKRIDDIERRIELEKIIEEYSEKIYGKSIEPKELERAWLKRSEIIDENKKVPKWIYYQDYYMKTQKRKGVHNVISDISLMPILFDEDVEQLSLPENESERLYQEYLYDKNVIDNFFKTEEIRLIDESESIKRIQDILIDMITKKGIVVESNPTSNWRILGIENSKYIPAVQWIQKNKKLRFTLNVDDPSLFYNSVIGEYYLVYSALKSKFKSAERLSDDEIIGRMDKLREESLNSLFSRSTNMIEEKKIETKRKTTRNKKPLLRQRRGYHISNRRFKIK